MYIVKGTVSRVVATFAICCFVLGAEHQHPLIHASPAAVCRPLEKGSRCRFLFRASIQKTFHEHSLCPLRNHSLGHLRHVKTNLRHGRTPRGRPLSDGRSQSTCKFARVSNWIPSLVLIILGAHLYWGGRRTALDSHPDRVKIACAETPAGPTDSRSPSC